MKDFRRGLIAGIPIALGYLSVSFTVGIMGATLGLCIWQTVLISMTCLTSAGQLAGIGIMVHPGQYMQMLISQLTINIRYSFMAVSLSQKADSKFSGIFRWIFGFFITDEIFAVFVQENALKRSYMAGTACLPWIGWSFGTLLGASLGAILPDRIMSALAVAIYAMFIAIVVPEMKKSTAVIWVVSIAVLLSCLFYYVPALQGISSGITISVCAIVAAVVGALVFPVEVDLG